MKMQRFYWSTRPKANGKNIIKGKNYRFTVLTESLIRLEYDVDGQFEDRASQSVFYRDFPENAYTVVSKNGKIIVETDNLLLTYSENGEFNNKNLSIKLKNEPMSSWNYGDDFEDLGGTVKTLDTINGPLPLGRGVCSRLGFSVLDDSETMLLNSESGWVETRKKDTIDCYFFGYGYRYIDAVKDFYRLTGNPPLLPAYALGNWWSRYYKYTQSEYIELMDKFRNENIPFSVGVIDMDWHLVNIPDDIKEELRAEYDNMDSGWTGYSWNEKLFPDYKEMLKILHEKNLKITLNLHPAQGVRKHEVMFEKMAREMNIDFQKECVIPFDILSPEYMEKYFDVLHHPYEKDGVDFWWMDYQQGLSYWWIHKKGDEKTERDEREVLDPLWMLNHLHILDITESGKRPMLLSRFCGAGSQRYPIGFSGDTYVTWETLSFQPYFTVTASNIGYCWWSHDIGGHMPGYRDNELNVRWLQFGVFSPINRLHSSSNDFLRKEPWCYDEKYAIIIKKWLNLRHDLFPYIYTMNYRNHHDLLPLMQPMYYLYPKSSGAYEVKNQYWFGSELIVAPITEPCSVLDGLGCANVWMPKGHWFDFFNGSHYFSSKDRKIQVYRTIEEYPVFAKAGAIVPLVIREKHDNRLINFEEMKVTIFPGASNEFSLYEDAGEGFDYQNGSFCLTKMILDWKDQPLFSIMPANNDVSLIPKERNWMLNFRSFHEDVKFKVTVNGTSVEFEYSFEKETNTHVIKVHANVTDKIDVEVIGEKYIHDNSDAMERCFNILQKSNMSIKTKTAIYHEIKDETKSIHSRMCRISSSSPQEDHLHRAIREQLTLTKDEFDKYDGLNYI